jgi:hypothetical protein
MTEIVVLMLLCVIDDSCISIYPVASYGGWKGQTPERTDRCREIIVGSIAEAALN